MSDKVIDIHKITNEQVINQPIFPQVARMISFVLKGKHVIAWNLEFDWKLLMHMFQKYDIAKPEVAGLSCAMDKYSEWCGEWSDRKQGFKWQRLPNLLGIEAHDAYHDCQNTLKAMEKMVGAYDEAALDADAIDLDF
jgi:DNA polymerase-3 subunit epsilon